MTNNITFTIDFVHVWVAVKVVAAFFITKKELQYPIWKDGIQIPRRLHQIARTYLRHALINPEWGLVKTIGFIPVWLFGGKTYMDKFMPWKVATPPPFCSRCKDKGQYYEKSFFSGDAAKWVKCECIEQNPMLRPDVECVVCLDKGNVGPDRPCMHCKRRKEQKSQPQSPQCQSEGTKKIFGAHCAVCKEHFTTTVIPDDRRWVCDSCNAKVKLCKVATESLPESDFKKLVKEAQEWAVKMDGQ